MESGRTLPVDSYQRHVVRNASTELGHTGRTSVCAFGLYVSNDDVAEDLAVDTRAFDSSSDGSGQEVVRGKILEGSLACAADRGAVGGDDNNIILSLGSNRSGE